MALTSAEKQVIIERAHTDKIVGKALLKEIIREAVKDNPSIVDNAVKKLDSKKVKRK